jgi:hypothetical protein
MLANSRLVPLTSPQLFDLRRQTEGGGYGQGVWTFAWLCSSVRVYVTRSIYYVCV